MGKKGEKKCQKSLAVSKVRKFPRKENPYAMKCLAGTHKAEESVPLSFALINLINAVNNQGEAKAVLNAGKVMVDRVERKNPAFPVGLFDLISLNGKKHYQMVFDGKGRLVAEEVDAEKSKTKLCKVLGKKAVKGELIRISTNDGRVFEGKKLELKTGDTIKVSLPEQKIVERIELKKGKKAYIIAGRHAGEEGTVKEISAGKMNIPSIVSLQGKETEFKTVAKNIMVIE